MTGFAHPGPDAQESLAAALNLALRSCGAARSPRELASVLGLHGAVVACPGICAGRWSLLGRDLALCGVAEFYGLRLRDLHPPDAARGLQQSLEFSQHFIDSYAPLIRRALASGQTALAWCGWPPPDELGWGYICGERQADAQRPHPEFIGLVGAVEPAQKQTPVCLRDPAYQVYIVEEYVRPLKPPDVEQLLARAAESARAFCDPRRAGEFGVQSGSEAAGAWRILLGSLSCPACGNGARSCQLAAVRHVGDSFAALAAWLQSLSIAGGRDPRAARWRDLARAVAAAAHVLTNSLSSEGGDASVTAAAFFAALDAVFAALPGFSPLAAAQHVPV